MAQILVVIGWILLFISSLSIGRIDGNTERVPEIAKFLAEPSLDTFGPFFVWMFGIVVVTGFGAYLGLVAWTLAGIRSGRLLALVGLCVVLFAILYSLLL